MLVEHVRTCSNSVVSRVELSWKFDEFSLNKNINEVSEDIKEHRRFLKYEASDSC